MSPSPTWRANSSPISTPVLVRGSRAWCTSFNAYSSCLLGVIGRFSLIHHLQKMLRIYCIFAKTFSVFYFLVFFKAEMAELAASNKHLLHLPSALHTVSYRALPAIKVEFYNSADQEVGLKFSRKVSYIP